MADLTDTLKIEAVERLSDIDKSILDLTKMKRELAASQFQNMDLQYNNLILQLAIRYKLSDGDKIEDNGTISRKTTGE